jgi:hypothetical protein
MELDVNAHTPVSTAPLLIWGTAGTDTGIGTAQEAAALIADGIIDADGFTVRAHTGTDRTFRIVFHRDFRREMAGMDWRLAITGRGHWCEGSDGRGNPGHAGTFRSAAEAVAAGFDWIETGREPSQQRRAA